MAHSLRLVCRKVWRTLGSIETGVILIILIVIFSAAGTVILQRPATDAEEMERAYSPQMLRILDSTGLTDVFHSHWFVALLILVSATIIAASIQRFPNVWRYFARPYKYPSEQFRRLLQTQTQIPITNEKLGLEAAERALLQMHFKPERISGEKGQSVFCERHRISEMAVYVVHASLLLIFLGGIVDALYGWRGFLVVTPGEQSSQVTMRNGSSRLLPFSIRCDGTGEETYTDGTPKRWWSRLAVIENGQEIQDKEIVVNDPLVHSGLRFYQASYGTTGQVDHLDLVATPNAGVSGEKREVSLTPSKTVSLDSDTTVQLAEFFRDYALQDGHVYARSDDFVNPAVHMIVTSSRDHRTVNYWLPRIPGLAQNDLSPYILDIKDLEPRHYSGLEVSYEPGQWAVWTGAIGMGIGLTFVFYIAHVRLWALTLTDPKGKLLLWIGGTSNRNRDMFEQRFQKLAAEIQKQLQHRAADIAAQPSTLVASD